VEKSKASELLLPCHPVGLESNLYSVCGNNASLAEQEIQGKQHIGRKIQQEESMITEREQTLQAIERIKMEAEKDIQNLNREIRSRKSKVDIWKELLRD